MRKLLLGSTAVAAAALFAPGGASAQTLSGDAFSSSLGAPATSMRGLEVRIGGYYRAMYNYTRQEGINVPGASVGSSDFSNEIEIHILAAGKAANGLRYGVALEIENDAWRTPGGITGNSVAAGQKNTLNYDEAWAYLAGPWGQIRFGDEDGAVAQLQSGHITGFGVGGLDSGDNNQQVIGGNYRRNLVGPNDLGDNTKLIYLSPQFFGFDAGASFAFNSQEGSLSGCDAVTTTTVTTCDRLSVSPAFSARRRNEIQAAVRWRGSFGPVGLAATVGYIGADSVRNAAGPSADRQNTVWAGAAVTGYGLTVGGWATRGNYNGNFNNVQRLGPNGAGGVTVDDRVGTAFLAGLTYTIDAFTIGGHYSTNWTAGAQGLPAGRRDRGWAVGGNYRIAPGLDFFAEYLKYDIKERGFVFNTSNPAQTTDSVSTDIVLAGFRVAF